MLTKPHLSCIFESGPNAHFFFGQFMDTVLLLNRVESLVGPVVENLGFELIERELVQDQGRWVLRLYIDRENQAITVADCETASRALEPVLDVEEIFPFSYTLEVSSPGLNRPLRRAKDFVKFAGERIELKTSEDFQGRRNFSGVLKGMKENNILLEQWEIPLQILKKAKVQYNFEKGSQQRRY